MSAIDLKRLASDLNYWNRFAPDDEATHYCTKSEGFEYLDSGSECDIPKPGGAESEITTLRQQLSESEARVAMLEHFADAVLSDMEVMDESQGVAGWHLNGEIATWDEVGLVGAREGLLAARENATGKAWLLRKQAEAFEAFVKAWRSSDEAEEWFTVSPEGLNDYAQRLRQAADELEAGGGNESA